MRKIRFALPKGSLEEATFRLLERAWYEVSGRERTYRPATNDPEIELKILRPQEIPVFVAEGQFDVGITGKDWIQETQADLETLLDLEYGLIRLVLAVPDALRVRSLGAMLRQFARRKRPLRISTEYLNLSAQYVQRNPVYRQLYGEQAPLLVTPWWRQGSNRQVVLYLSFGATEAKPPEETDAIIDVTQTGATLQQNNLRILDTLLTSTAVLVANRAALAQADKREKIYDIITLLKGVIESEKKLHIFVNVQRRKLPQLLAQLPALKRPTISPLADRNWYSVNTVVEKQAFLRLLPKLRKLAQGLVVHEPQQVLPLEEVARGENAGK
jgi:ATP phosphoribosyltransferase